MLPYQCFVVVMASHSHVQLDASRKTRCYCYLINHTRLIHSDFRVSLVCFAGHKTKKFRSKRPAPRQTTTKRKLLSAHVIFAKLGLIHRPNYLTLANRWGPNNNVNKSCSFFFSFRCHHSESPRNLLAIEWINICLAALLYI